MPYNAALDSKEDRTESVDTIHFREYKTRDHYVFSVYRGRRHWKRLKRRKSPKTMKWVERVVNGPSCPAAEQDVIWLNRVWENQEEYTKIIRFPRTSQKLWQSLPRFDPSQVANTKWLIESLLAEGSIQLVFGERGSFKSTFMLAAAKAVANGEQFLGRKTRRRKVLYLDYENPANILKGRDSDLDLGLATNDYLLVWDRFGPHPTPTLDDPTLEVLVEECVAETGHGPWIIFDSWASLMKPGEGGEFTGQIAEPYRHLRRLADLGATITVLDHTRKYDKNTIYGGQDKEAKADSIHSLTVFPNKTTPTNPIIRVDSWHKRAAPKGIGSFAFKVQSTQDRHGKWHITALVPAQDPEKAKALEDIEVLRGLIKQNPTSGQEALARLAADGDLSRDQAIRLLKEGIGKHWQIRRMGHNKLRYFLI